MLDTVYTKRKQSFLHTPTHTAFGTEVFHGTSGQVLLGCALSGLWVLMQWALGHWLSTTQPYTLALACIVAAAFFGTWRAGLFTALACQLLTYYFLVQPSHSRMFEHEVLGGTSYYLIVGLILFLNHRAAADKKALHAAVAQFRETDARKSQFLAVLSHELRNPLAAIRTTTDLLNSETLGLPEVGHARKVLDRQVSQITRVVDELLVGRSAEDKLSLQLENVPVSSIVASAADAAKVYVTTRGQTLNVKVAVDVGSVHVDTACMAQVLGNLLHNASTFSPPGSQIKLDAERLGDQVCFTVSDSGEGIAADSLQSIFDPFMQLSRSSQGLGLGLAIVRRMCALQRGSVEAFSTGPGRGASFRVSLPRSNEHSAELPSSSVAPVSAPPLKVLVVDDNVDSGESMALLLDLRGFSTSFAHDGASGVARALAEHPDVVLMDIGLPDMSGLEAGRRITQGMNGHSPVLVALTGWGTAEDQARSKAAGFQHHLTKPVSAQQVSELLTSIQRQQQLRACSQRPPVTLGQSR
ncbi:MAG: ATP-binding protein [Ramlibacter sp.]